MALTLALTPAALAQGTGGSGGTDAEGTSQAAPGDRRDGLPQDVTERWWAVDAAALDRATDSPGGAFALFTELVQPKALVGDLWSFLTVKDNGNLALLGFGLGLSAVGLDDLDDAAFDMLEGDKMGKFNDGFHLIGSRSFLYPTLAGVFVVGKAVHDEGIAGTAAEITQALLLTDLMVTAGKEGVRRTRPDGSDTNSFPSGHTAGMFAIARVLDGKHGSKVGIPAYVLAACVAVSRIDQRRHYLSDVIAGATLGIIMGNIVGQRSGWGGLDVHVIPGPRGGAGLGFAVGF